MPNIWIFSNKHQGYYEDSDWDTSTILRTKSYYFKTGERNRAKTQKNDLVIFREYGSGFWGTCVIKNDWVNDSKALEKHGKKAGWFPISNIKKWEVILPYELIHNELSNRDHISRIVKASESDLEKIEFARKIYHNLGYGDTDGSYYVLESGIEEAVKANLSQLNLRLADDDIQQQCNLGIGVGRTDLICRDKDDNYVVLELKAAQSSDQVVGQILRYMGFIRENWALKENKDVSGIILTPSYDEQLRFAAKEARIKVLRIRI